MRVRGLAGVLIALSFAPWSAARAAGQEGAAATPAAVSWGAEVDLARRYVWLGLPFSSTPVLQPSLWVSRGLFTLNLWGNANLAGEGQSPVSELDVIASWGGKAGPVAVLVTSDTYLWREPGSHFVNTELFLRTGLPVGPVEVFAVQLLDLRTYSGSYHLAVGAAWSLERRKLTWQAQATTGWGSARFHRSYLGVDERGLLEATLELGVTWRLSRHLHVRPHVAVTTLLDPDLGRASEDRTILNPGIAIGLR